MSEKRPVRLFVAGLVVENLILDCFLKNLVLIENFQLDCWLQKVFVSESFC